MKYRLKSDPSVTVEVCDLGGQEAVNIPTSVFKAAFELVGENRFCKYRSRRDHSKVIEATDCIGYVLWKVPGPQGSENTCSCPKNVWNEGWEPVPENRGSEELPEERLVRLADVVDKQPMWTSGVFAGAISYEYRYAANVIRELRGKVKNGVIMDSMRENDRNQAVNGFESELRGVLARHSMLVTSSIPIDVGVRFVRRVVEALDEALMDRKKND
jgi:hypothetical protein